jgi:hypothetical protein
MYNKIPLAQSSVLSSILMVPSTHEHVKYGVKNNYLSLITIFIGNRTNNSFKRYCEKILRFEVLVAVLRL